MTIRVTPRPGEKPEDHGAVWRRPRSAGKYPDAEKLVGLAYLVADGSRFVRATVKEALHGMGIRSIAEAENAEAALGRVGKHAVDAVIVGYALADMSGIELVRRLRRNGNARLQRLPVIMISENADEARVRQAIDAGVNEFLPRPFSRADLYVRVRRSILAPKPFIVSADYIGPDRRLKDSGPGDGIEKRGQAGGEASGALAPSRFSALSESEAAVPPE